MVMHAITISPAFLEIINRANKIPKALPVAAVIVSQLNLRLNLSILLFKFSVKIDYARLL